MRCNGYIVRMRHIGDLARFQQAATFLEIGHDDIRRSLFEKLSETPAHIEVLSTADRSVGGCADIPHRVDVLGRHRFLKPHQLEWLQFLGDFLASGSIIAGMHVDREIKSLAILLARKCDFRDHVLDLAV